MNIRLILAYDGTHYLGWQNSIETVLQSILEQVLQQKVVLQAASRTDAGVHARGQVVNFFLDEKRDLNKLKYSVNQLLPQDIVILEMSEAAEQFHPTLDAISKEYHYHLSLGHAQLPFYRHYSWHYPHPLDLEKMREAASFLVGKHDFSAFCNVKKGEKETNFVRELYKIEIEPEPDERLIIKMCGNRFLYRMARNIVGTLVYVGRGKITLQEVKIILESKNRTNAGMTAPAHGLTLFAVNYN